MSSRFAFEPERSIQALPSELLAVTLRYNSTKASSRLLQVELGFHEGSPFLADFKP